MPALATLMWIKGLREEPHRGGVRRGDPASALLANLNDFRQ